MDQVCRCTVEHDQIDVATDRCCQIGGEVDTQPFQGSRGIGDKQNAKVDVAGRTGGTTRLAGEELAQRLDKCG